MSDEDIDRKVDATVALLDAGVTLQYFAKPGEHPPALYLSNRDEGGKSGSNPAAKFEFFHRQFLDQFFQIAETWNGTATAIQDSPDPRVMVGAFLNNGDWDQAVRRVYNTTTPLLETLRRAADEWKVGAKLPPTPEAEIEARKVYPHLAIVENFRTLAEEYLGIEPTKPRAR